MPVWPPTRYPTQFRMKKAAAAVPVTKIPNRSKFRIEQWSSVQEPVSQVISTPRLPVVFTPM